MPLRTRRFWVQLLAGAPKIVIMSKRYSGKSFKDSNTMKKAKLSFKEKRKLKREKKRKYEL